MQGVPDSNDIVVRTYGIDYGPFFQWFTETLLGLDPDAALETLSFWWAIYSIFAILLSLLFFVGFVYAKIRYTQSREIEMDRVHAGEIEWARIHDHAETRNNRWEEIQRHVVSQNPSDWRLAIIEADILLEQTLNNAGYVGTTIGDKLKSASASSFQTLQDAWEAHKVRNEIAHSGSDFVLTRKSTNETIVRYERVFREFGVI